MLALRRQPPEGRQRCLHRIGDVLADLACSGPAWAGTSATMAAADNSAMRGNTSSNAAITCGPSDNPVKRGRDWFKLFPSNKTALLLHFILSRLCPRAQVKVET